MCCTGIACLLRQLCSLVLILFFDSLLARSIGVMIGFVMCSTLFSLVSSAVNTVIVCYAEAPHEFEQNHPQLSEQMRSSWRQAYPAEFRY